MSSRKKFMRGAGSTPPSPPLENMPVVSSFKTRTTEISQTEEQQPQREEGQSTSLPPSASQLERIQQVNLNQSA